MGLNERSIFFVALFFYNSGYTIDLSIKIINNGMKIFRKDHATKMKKEKSARPTGFQISRKRKQKKEAEKKLREEQKAEGLKKNIRKAVPNAKCKHATCEEEQIEREETLTNQLKIMKKYLPILLKRLSKIKDPRQLKKCKHKMTVLLIYGILSFVFQMSSRREANQEMSRPMFFKNLQIYFPELESMPHNDTLKRLLDEIDVNAIEMAHIDLIRNFIRKKKFRRYLIDNCFPIAIDGTQKFVREEIWSEECLERKTGSQAEEKQYYVYVLEASLAFHNGMTIPLMSEFLSYTKGDNAKQKQDCETKAFHRLAKRLKKEFPRLPVMLLLDGLYPNGPIFEHCIKNRWQFMIVLKNKSLKSLWEEFNALKQLEKNNQRKMKWGNRNQHFQWVNNLEYWYGEKEKNRVILHLVTCQEKWQEVNAQCEVEEKKSSHAWISSEPLSWKNVHERCNLGARHRWGIETNLLIEKCHGFQYEHDFSYNWNSMKGYHYLMRIGDLFITLARYSELLARYFNEMGIKGFINFIRSTISAPWINEHTVLKKLKSNYQLRLL